jgi:transposase
VAASAEEIRERAARIANASGMDEEEAVEMLAIATGLSDGCLQEEDEDGCLLPRKLRRLADPREP